MIDKDSQAYRDEEAAGRVIGDRIGRAVADVLGAPLRALYAAIYGRCRVCDAPLGGPSPERICEPCHAGEVLAHGLGGATGGEA